MKKYRFGILALSLVGILAACASSGSGVVSSIASNGVVAEEDRARPDNTSLNDYEYTDYSMLGEKPQFDKTKWYRNDMETPRLPDPFVLEVGNKYYIYGTTDRTGSQTLDCYETEDFQTFTLHKDIYTDKNSSWGNNSFFAPEVYYLNGKYYMYFSDNSKGDEFKGLRYISAVCSDTPYGPFVEYKGKDANGQEIDGSEKPLFMHNKTIGYSALDQTVFKDDDGELYMYYSIYHTGVMQYIVGVHLLDPVTPDWDTYKILVRPGELTPKTTNSNMLSWECYESFKVAEGPFLIKSPKNGKYYLTYSVNHYPDRYYTVCYAFSSSPLGDYEKPYEKGQNWTNLLFGYAAGMAGTKTYDQWEGFMSGTAHHCFFKSGDEYMIGYHAHKNRSNSDAGRNFAMDHLYFDEDGVPFTHGPTSSIEPLPTKISGYSNVALGAKVKSYNIKNADRINDNYIVEHYNLQQEQDREVTINTGESCIELDFDKPYEIGGINIYNSAFYDKALSEISFINFFNGNVVYNVGFCQDYVNDEKEFIFPGSAFTVNYDGFTADRVVIGFNTTTEAQINEITVLGK